MPPGDPNVMTHAAHQAGYLGEQGIGFMLGAEGYFFVDGPSGGGGHGVNAKGFDGIAYHPGKNELIIYDNKAYAAATNVTHAPPIDPEKRLNRYLDELIEHVEKHPNLKRMPNRAQILKQLKQTRGAVQQWIKAGKPAGALRLPGKVRLVVYNAWGNSVGVGGKLAASGAVEFVDVGQAPKVKLNEVAEMELKRLANETQRAGTRAAEAVEQRLVSKGEQLVAGEGVKAALSSSAFTKTMGKAVKRIIASKAAKRALGLAPVIGWALSAKDAYAGVKDVMAGRVYRGMSGVGLATADVLADVLHIGDLVSGVGGTALSLGVQAGTTSGQILIETQRVEEKMQELQAEIAKLGKLPTDQRMREHYELDDESIAELKQTVGPQLVTKPAGGLRG